MCLQKLRFVTKIGYCPDSLFTLFEPYVPYLVYIEILYQSLFVKYKCNTMLHVYSKLIFLNIFFREAARILYNSKER